MKDPIGSALVSMSVILTSAASADVDVVELIRKWELAGAWSTDCSPEARPHGVVAYRIEPDGRTIIDNGQSVTEMRIAVINTHGDLVLHTTEASAGETRTLVLRRSEDMLRPVADGKNRDDYTIRDGKFVASLKETLPLRRCRN